MTRAYNVGDGGFNIAFALLDMQFATDDKIERIITFPFPEEDVTGLQHADPVFPVDGSDLAVIHSIERRMQFFRVFGIY